MLNYTSIIQINLFKNQDSLEDTKRCLIWRRNLEVFLNDNQSNWIEIIQQNNINYESLKNEFYSKNGLLSNENNIDHNKLFTCEGLDRPLIDKDMNRLYITAVQDEYFQNSITQDTIKRVLTVWCANHYPQYRQGMHEVCGLLHLALNKEAQAWSESIYDTSNDNQDSLNSWSQFMSKRFHSKKSLLLSKLENTEDEKQKLDLTNELNYCFCEESDLYTLFDRVMMRGLRVVYCPEVTDGLPYQETEINGIVSNPSIGYLNLIQDVLLKIIHPALWDHLQISMIQPQLYGISWARLLFGRVYVSTDSLLFRVWDYIFEPASTSTRTTSTTSTTRAPSTSISELSDSNNSSFQPKSLLIEDRLNKLISYNIQDPLLMKLACFILGLVLELRKELLSSDEVTTLTVLMRYTANRRYNKNEDHPTKSATIEIRSHIDKIIQTARQCEGLISLHEHLLISPQPTQVATLLQLLRRPYRGEFSHLSPLSTIVLEGYLQKRGRMIKSWKTRWIVLTKTDLSYYTDETKTEKRGCYKFTTDTQIQIEDGRSNRLKFGLVSPTNRTRVFMTSNEESREMWVHTLEEVLGAYRDMIHMGDDSVWGEVLDGEEKDDVGGVGVIEDSTLTKDQIDENNKGNRTGVGLINVFRRGNRKVKAGTKGEFLNQTNNIFIRNLDVFFLTNSLSTSSISSSLLPSKLIENNNDNTTNSTNTMNHSNNGEPNIVYNVKKTRLSHKPIPVTTILLAGWLTKRGHINLSWKVRWFECVAETITLFDGKVVTEYYLNYYGDKTDSIPSLTSNNNNNNNNNNDNDNSSEKSENKNINTTSNLENPTLNSSPSPNSNSNQALLLGRVQLTAETLILNRSLGSKAFKFALYNPPSNNNDEIHTVQAKVSSGTPINQSPSQDDDMYATEMVAVGNNHNYSNSISNNNKDSNNKDESDTEENDEQPTIEDVSEETIGDENQEKSIQIHQETSKKKPRRSFWNLVSGKSDENQEGNSKLGQWLSSNTSKSYILFLSAVSEEERKEWMTGFRLIITKLAEQNQKT